MQKEMTALARKRIASLAVGRLDMLGAYDCEYDDLALAITRELGMPMPSKADLGDITGRIADLVSYRLEAVTN